MGWTKGYGRFAGRINPLFLHHNPSTIMLPVPLRCGLRLNIQTVLVLGMKKVRLSLKDTPYKSKNPEEISAFLDKFEKFVAHTDYYKDRNDMGDYPEKIITVTFTPYYDNRGHRWWQRYDSVLKSNTYASDDMGMMEAIIIYAENFEHYNNYKGNIDGYLKDGATLKGCRTRAPAKKRTPAVRVNVRKMF